MLFELVQVLYWILSLIFGPFIHGSRRSWFGCWYWLKRKALWTHHLVRVLDKWSPLEQQFFHLTIGKQSTRIWLWEEWPLIFHFHSINFPSTISLILVFQGGYLHSCEWAWSWLKIMHVPITRRGWCSLCFSLIYLGCKERVVAIKKTQETPSTWTLKEIAFQSTSEPLSEPFETRLEEGGIK